MRVTLIIDLLCLQGAWFTAAILHDRATPWLLLILLIRLCLLKDIRGQIKPALVIIAVGLCTELVMNVSGAVRYQSAYIMPLWLPLLWVIFAFTMSHGLQLIKKLKLPVQALVGAISGCLSYQAAAAFDVLSLMPDRTTASLVLMIIWAFTLPLLASAYGSRKTGTNS